METTFEFKLIHGGDDPLQGLQDVSAPNSALDKAFDDGNAEVPNPVARFFERAERNQLTKNVGGISDASWDEPLMKTTAETDPAALPPRSQARLEKTYAVINRIFNGHETEAAEARGIAKRLLIETRAEVMAAVA
jgi:hypothetical protein